MPVSDANASYAFLPWLRLGVSAAVNSGTPTSASGRLEVPVAVSFGPERRAEARLELAGPREVVGIDPRLVIRTWPRSGVGDAEANLFPMVELEVPDLPWRYTPLAPSADDRLAPWLALLVFRDEEIASLVPAGETRPLPTVSVRDAPLPRLSQAWAWAHVQVVGESQVDRAKALSIWKSEPHRLSSRLMCARKLDPETRYTAVLVPTFEAGRRVGAGLALDDLADPEAPAWQDGATTAELPIYYQFGFATGASGDFESLVRRLRSARLPITVGRRDMDVSDPGSELPPASSSPLSLEGALRAPGMDRSSWLDAERAPFVAALGAFLNRPKALLQDGAGVRAVAPPLYAQWYAAEASFSPNATPAWFQDLNGDPRDRVAAGLGTRVVQANQSALVAAAWERVGPALDVHDDLRLSQFAVEVSLRLHERHLGALSTEDLLQVTAPVHSRILASPTTVAARVAESSVSGALASGWRRAARPLGPVGVRQARPRAASPELLGRLNRRELVIGSPPPTPSDLVTPSRAGAGLVPAGIDAAAIEKRRVAERRLLWGGLAAVAAAPVALFAGAPLLAAVGVGAAGAASSVASVRRRRATDRLELGLAVRDGAVGSATIADAPANPGFAARESPLLAGTATPPVAPSAAPPAANGESSSARAFRTAATVFLQAAESAPPIPAVEPARLDLSALRSSLESALDPRSSIAAALRARIDFASVIEWHPRDPLEPVLLGPEIDRPMYEPLAELSKECLLPGLESVAANSVTLAETNPRFIEAYMAGLNHEMGRELLWRRFPTDQRKTFFRQFWDPAATVAGGDPEAQKDIPPLDRWRTDARLGENAAGGTAPRLVLVVRGDLVHRYPNFLASAIRAEWTATGRKLSSEEKQPLFAGRLEPDVAFFGFALTVAEVRSASTVVGEGDPGWFFVIQEQPSEPKFGLDVGDAGAAPPGSWNDLNWGQLAATPAALSALGYVDLDTDLPDTRGVASPPAIAWHGDAGLGPAGTRASHLAYITLQRPMRVAVHANDLLLAPTPATP